MLFDKIDNIFSAHGELVLTRTCKNQRIFWIESVMRDLRFDRIGVGRKRRILH